MNLRISRTFFHLAVTFTVFLTACGSDDEVTVDFDDQSFIVSEQADVGAVLGEIPEAVSISINSGNEDGVFSSDGNEIILAKQVDFETTSTYSLAIEACTDEACGGVTVIIEVTDEEETFSFNNTGYILDNGLIFDYGAVNYVDESAAPSHHNFDFFLLDGNLRNNQFETTALVYIELLSPGTEGFRPGFFNFTIPQESADVDGISYFELMDIRFDTNQNNSIDDDEDLSYLPTGGVVEVVSNGGNSYTLRFDIELIELDRANQVLVGGSETSLNFEATIDFSYTDLSSSARLETPAIDSKHYQK